jgi:hypothetical protein
MSASVLDLVDIFDGEGAFVFGLCPTFRLTTCTNLTFPVDRPVGGPPVFHVQTSAELRAGNAQVAGRSGSQVMLATEELRKYPLQLISKKYLILYR